MREDQPQGDLSASGKAARPRIWRRPVGSGPRRSGCEEPQQGAQLPRRRSRWQQLVGDVRECDQPKPALRPDQLLQHVGDRAVGLRLDAARHVEHEHAGSPTGQKPACCRRVASARLAREQRKHEQHDRERDAQHERAACRAGQLGSACDRDRRTARACRKRATRHVRSTAARSDAGRPASTAEWLQESASVPPRRARGRRGPAGSRRYASARVTAARVPCVSQLRLPLDSVRSTSRTARSSALGSGSRSRPCSARKTRQRAKAAPAKRSALTTSNTVFNTDGEKRYETASGSVDACQIGCENGSSPARSAGVVRVPSVSGCQLSLSVFRATAVPREVEDLGLREADPHAAAAALRQAGIGRAHEIGGEHELGQPIGVVTDETRDTDP